MLLSLLFSISTRFIKLSIGEKHWIDVKLVVAKNEGIQFLSHNIGYPFLRHETPMLSTL